ncbi:hypothetical protein GGI42DRAFT_325729, partial [Trichoderma sp. SZMC 28013]
MCSCVMILLDIISRSLTLLPWLLGTLGTVQMVRPARAGPCPRLLGSHMDRSSVSIGSAVALRHPEHDIIAVSGKMRRQQA